MKTRLLSVKVAELILPAVHIACKHLRQGKLVAFPTDTVYGLGADLFNPVAIEGLYTAKGREATKAIAVLVGRLSDLLLVTAGMSAAAERLTERFWPGPLTLVVNRQPGLPDTLSSLPTVGVRMPDHVLALTLLRTIGPLAVTSANISGAESAVTAGEVLAQLGGRISLVLDGGQTPGGSPSTVVDCTGTEPVIIRIGPVSEQEIQSALYG